MLLTPDLSKFGRPTVLHIAMHALDLFQQSNGRLPTVRDAADADAVVDIAKKFAAGNAEVSEAGNHGLPDPSAHAVRDVIVCLLVVHCGSPLA